MPSTPLPCRSLRLWPALLLPALAAAQTPLPTPQAPEAAPAAKPADQPPEPKPWRVQSWFGDGWFRLSGSERLRYEHLDNQFRADTRLGSSEDLLVMQTLLLAEARFDDVTFALEVLDARQYGADASSFLDTTFVNTADVLQAYVDFSLGELGDGKHRLRLGRETVDLGGRRVMARNAYRNTINAFTGVDWYWQQKNGDSLRLFWTLPVDRRPATFDELRDNDWEEDDQDLDVMFYGGMYDRRLDARTNLELYVVQLDETGPSTRRRQLTTPGLRLFRPRKAGEFHFELEGTVQFGESRTAATTRDLDHLAFFGHTWVGYTFDTTWKPSVQFAYDYATGDQDPNDDDNERYDTLFGARRWEFGPTGTYGPIARANLNSPEIRVSAQPSKTMELMLGDRLVWLASERDTWTAAGVRDATGRSGEYVGQQFEARFRWEPLPRNLRLDIGACYLLAGGFQDRAPNGRGSDTTHAYVEVSFLF